MKEAFGSLSFIVPSLAIISGVVNLLALTGSLYMLQVYDRVLTSHNVPTLVALSVLAIGLYLFQGVLELVRSRVFVRLASRFDMRLSKAAHGATLGTGLDAAKPGAALQPIQDVETVRSFIASPAPMAIFDLPWMPIYLTVIFLLHPALGWMTFGGAIFLLGLTLLTERLVKAPSRKVGLASKQRLRIAESASRNAEVLKAMGFGHRLSERYADANLEHLAAQERLSTVVNTMSISTKIFRMVLQSALLGVGAYLTLRGELTGGAIVASSITASRALAPIEVAIAHWKAFVAARHCIARLENIMQSLGRVAAPLPLPKPQATVAVDNITVAIPENKRLVVSNVRFELQAGQVMALIGPSAAGKSCMARALTGIWPVLRGAVRLDGASLDRWTPADLGHHIGYLPQDIELLDGTITENISRFERNPDSRAVIAAAKAADVHEMILRLPEGYETALGPGGMAFSAGQRQRLGLARALYGDPFLVVLDEPNSNLDADGEVALVNALKGVAARGGVAIVIAHRPSVLAAADVVGVMTAGQLSAFGPRDEVLRKVLKQQQGAPAAVAPTTGAI